MGHADTNDIHLGFEFRRKVEPVNWKKIASIDIDRICNELDFQTLQDNVTHVTFCNIESEVDTKNLDPSFIKLFRLSQLIIEYLLSTQEYLTSNVESFEKKNEVLEKELSKLREELKEMEKLTKELKKENKKRRRMIEDQQREIGISPTKTVLFQCFQCPKTFMSPFYLQNHIQRRHFNCEKPEKNDISVQAEPIPIKTQPEKPSIDSKDEKFEMVKMFEEWKKLISLEREEQKHQIMSANENLIKELEFLKRRQEDAEKELAELRTREAMNQNKLLAEEESRMTRKSSLQDQERRNSMDVLHLQLENQHKIEIEQLKYLLKQQEQSFRDELKKSVEELKHNHLDSKNDLYDSPTKTSRTTKKISNTNLKFYEDKKAIKQPRRSLSEDEIRNTTELSKNEIARLSERSRKNIALKKPIEVVKVSPAIVSHTQSSDDESEDSSEEPESKPDTPVGLKRFPAEKPFTSTPVKPPRSENTSKPSPSVIIGLKEELNSLVDERLNSYKTKAGSHSDLEKTLKLLEKDRSKKSSKIPNFGQLREKWRSMIAKKVTSPERTVVPAVRLVMETEIHSSPVRKNVSPVHKKDPPRNLKRQESLLNRTGSPTGRNSTLPEYRPTTSSMKNLSEKTRSDGAIPVKKLSFTEPEVRILNMTESSEEEDEDEDSTEEDSVDDVQPKKIPVVTHRSPVRTKPVEPVSHRSPIRTKYDEAETPRSPVRTKPVEPVPIRSPIRTKAVEPVTIRSPIRIKPKVTMYEEADSESLEELESVESERSSSSEEEEPAERVIKVRPPTSYKVAQLASSIEQQLANRGNPSSTNDQSNLEGKRRLAGSVDTLAPLRSSLNTISTSKDTLSAADDRGFYSSMSSTSKLGSKQSMDDTESVSSLEKLMQEIVSGDRKSTGERKNSQTVGNYRDRGTKESSWDSELDLS